MPYQSPRCHQVSKKMAITQLTRQDFQGSPRTTTDTISFPFAAAEHTSIIVATSSAFIRDRYISPSLTREKIPDRFLYSPSSHHKSQDHGSQRERSMEPIITSNGLLLCATFIINLVHQVCIVNECVVSLL